MERRTLLRLAPEHDVRGLLRRDELRAFVAQGAEIDPFEQSFSAAEQHWSDRDVHLVDQSRTEKLLYGIGPAADPDVHSVRSLARLIQEKDVAALLTRTMGEEESTDFLLSEIAKPLLQQARAEELGEEFGRATSA